MDPSTGIFLAPRNGIYTFHLAGAVYYPPSTTRIDMFLSLVLNDIDIGRTITTDTNVDGSWYTHSLHSTLELKAGDQVWISIPSLNGGALYDDANHYTHFTGYLLQENVASSLKL